MFLHLFLLFKIWNAFFFFRLEVSNLKFPFSSLYSIDNIVVDIVLYLILFNNVVLNYENFNIFSDVSTYVKTKNLCHCCFENITIIIHYWLKFDGLLYQFIINFYMKKILTFWFNHGVIDRLIGHLKGTIN